MKSIRISKKPIANIAKLIAVTGLTFGLIPGAAAADVTTAGTLNLVTDVVNTHSGMDSENAFSLRILSHGVEVAGSLLPGVSAAGRSYLLPVGTYIVSQKPAIGYRGIWSGPVTPGGTVVISAGSNVTVIRTIYDVELSVTTPVVTPVPVVTPNPVTDPVATETGGNLPDTATPLGNFLLLGAVLILTGTLGFASRKVLVKQ